MVLALRKDLSQSEDKERYIPETSGLRSERLDYRIVFRLSSLIEKERGYMYELKLVPTVLGNGQNDVKS